MTIEFKILKYQDLKHRGSDFIEILPGEFKDKWWNPESIFCREEEFEIVEMIIASHVPSYDHYANTPIDTHTCGEIILALEQLARVLTPTTTVAELKRLSLFERQRVFFENFDQNVLALREMVLELAAWLRGVMEVERSITILGI